MEFERPDFSIRPFFLSCPLMIIRSFYIITGCISLGLGFLGIFVPGMPTTPFLLLAAFLFARGSARMHRWLLNNRFVGSYITEWNKSKGLSRRTKIKSVTLMAIVLLISLLFMTKTIALKIIIIALGLIGIFFMGFIIPTTKN